MTHMDDSFQAWMEQNVTANSLGGDPVVTIIAGPIPFHRRNLTQEQVHRLIEHLQSLSIYPVGDE